MPSQDTEKGSTGVGPDYVIQSRDDGDAKSDLINASGHVQELKRNFGLTSLAGLGLTVGCVWPALGGSILVAIFNGGPPGQSYTITVRNWRATC